MIRFHKVTNNIFRGAAPSISEVKILKDKYNINKIVSLDKESGLKINRVCKLLNIQHEIAPLDETKKSLLNFSKYNLKDLLNKNGPTFIHCHEGKDRTGFVIALYKVKYLGVSPKKAIKEAEDLGFGNKKYADMIELYKKIILSAKSEDSNNADIVSNERQQTGEHHNMYLDSEMPLSFAPFLDPTVPGYRAIYDQSPTRDNYDESIIEHKDEEKGLPLVGNYNNNSNMSGMGLSGDMGGFIYDTK